MQRYNWVPGGGSRGGHWQPAGRQPRPLVRAEHPRSGSHATRRPTPVTRHPARRSGRHRRATVISGGNPAVVQLHGSDTLVSVPLAQHVAPASIVAGGMVVVLLFNEADPTDGLVVAVY